METASPLAAENSQRTRLLGKVACVIIISQFGVLINCVFKFAGISGHYKLISVGRASHRKAKGNVEAGSSPRCGKGFFPHS